MKPFNLEKALAGEPVITRDGRPVTQLTRFDVTDLLPLRGVVGGKLHAFSSYGKYTSSDSIYDLFMATNKRTVWINIYESCCGGPYETKGEATLRAGSCGPDLLGGGPQAIEIEE